MMKKLFTTALFVSTLSTAAMAAEDTTLAQYGFTVSGNVALTSDYRWRGQSQTQNDPAIQGTVTLAHSSGLYFSAFASNVDFGGDSAHLELDPTIGFATPITLGSIKPTLDFGVAYYNYPSNSDINYPEYYAKLIFADSIVKGDVLTPSVAYTNKYAGDSDVSNWNFNLAYSLPFADTGFGGVASVGYSKADKKIYGNDDNFFDWKAGVTYNFKSVAGLTAELDAVGTNMDGYTGVLDRSVDTGAVFSLTKTF
ncbi:TorF family putative porin [Acinetobacter brisouii]|uniref:TorF family putative porin n=1 Tax=Acinetobacter brisouii TaxID=396323 RepID=UPI0035CEA752